MVWKTGEKDIALLEELAFKTRKLVAKEKGVNVDVISAQLYRIRQRYQRYRWYINKIESLKGRFPHIKRALLPTKPPEGYLAEEEE